MENLILSTLLDDLWRDFEKITILWQIGAVLLSIVLGHGFASLIHGIFISSGTRDRLLRFEPDRFSRVLSPLFAFLILHLAKKIFAPWQMVSLIQVSIHFTFLFMSVRFIMFIVRRIFVRGTNFARELALLERALLAIILLWMLLYVFDFLPDILSFLSDTTIPIGRNRISIEVILQAIISVILTVMIAMWASAALETRLMKLESLNLSMRAVLVRICRAIFIFMAIIISLSMVGLDLTVLSVFGGALGVGLGLGLQRIVNNYVSGFIILMDGSLSIGDMVTVGNYYGKVNRINTRYSVIESISGIEYVIPNENLVFNPIENHTLSIKRTRVTTSVGVGYDSNIELVKQLLETCTQEISRILTDPPPSASFVKFGDSALEFELGWWVADPENGKQGVTSEVNFKIWHTLREHNIDIPFPIRDVRITERRAEPHAK